MVGQLNNRITIEVKDLEFFAIQWLRFEKGCHVALVERSPRFNLGRPDVLGITKDRYLMEIEVKRSVSDFRANFKKEHVSQRDQDFVLGSDELNGRWPKHFWYLVTPEIVESVKPFIPPWAGLLRGPKSDEVRQLVSVVKAPRNKASEPLTDHEYTKLNQCMANQLYCQAICIRSLIRSTTENLHRYWQTDYEI